MIEVNDLYDKVLLIGITFVTEENELIEQHQTHGTVQEIHSDYIRVKQVNGDLFTLPTAFENLDAAPPGDYRLNSTGEVVSDPDYISTWTVTVRAKDKIEHNKRFGFEGYTRQVDSVEAAQEANPE